MIRILDLDYVQDNSDFIEVSINVEVSDDRKQRHGLERTTVCVKFSEDEVFTGIYLWNRYEEEGSDKNIDGLEWDCIDSFMFTPEEEKTISEWIGKNVDLKKYLEGGV